MENKQILTIITKMGIITLIILDAKLLETLGDSNKL